MAYFGNTSSQASWNKVEPRTLFLIIWVILCAIVLFFIVNGGWKSDINAPTEVAPAVQASSTLPKEASAPVAPQQPVQVPVVSEKIPAGSRAVTISVDAESGVEGWVRPGARVDVVWISMIRGRQAITTIVENAEVLSAESSLESDPNALRNTKIPSHITLVVPAKDAQKIQLAKTTGSLSLNLRGTTDSEGLGNDTITVDGLLRNDTSNIKPDAVGWVQMNGKEFEVTASGKLRPSEEPLARSKDLLE